MEKGDRVYVRDDDGRILTLATVEETPKKNAKKVLLTLDKFDGDYDVCRLVSKSKVKPVKLPRGLKLFYADIIGDETSVAYWYIVGKTEDSAFKMFTKEANDCWWEYYYHFYELTIEDGFDENIVNFISKHEEEGIKAGIYWTDEI